MQESAKDISGILIVDKESGMTSHDVVAKVRKTFRFKKVGHAGTLDPMATGVLVLLLEKATKLSMSLSGEVKEYTAVMELGIATSSGDKEGTVIYKSDNLPNEEEIMDAVNFFLGEIEQIPPMVSAKKINGEKLYDLARKGITIDRLPVKINIEKIETEKIEMPLVHFKVRCSKGTYIRQLADDIGKRLGCGAHLRGLRRTRSGNFSIENAVTLSDIIQMDLEKLYENILRI